MSTEDSSVPGLPKVVFLCWILLTGVFVAVGIGHTIISVPTIALSYVLLPSSGSTYLFYGLLGWVVFYVVDTINLIRFNDIGELNELMETLLNNRRGKFLMFFVVYINVSIATIVLAAYLVGTAMGSLLLGAGVALLYPAVDVRLAVRGRSPAFFVLQGLLWLFHQFGRAREITAESVVRGTMNSPTY